MKLSSLCVWCVVEVGFHTRTCCFLSCCFSSRFRCTLFLAIESIGLSLMKILLYRNTTIHFYWLSQVKLQLRFYFIRGNSINVITSSVIAHKLLHSTAQSTDTTTPKKASHVWRIFHHVVYTIRPS